MEIKNVKSVIVVGQNIIYGTLVISLYKNEESQHFIDVEYATDGGIMTQDASIVISGAKYSSLLQTINLLLNNKIDTIDNGISYCYVEITDYQNDKYIYSWPEKLHSKTFRRVIDHINAIAQNVVISNFLSIF